MTSSNAPRVPRAVRRKRLIRTTYGDQIYEELCNSLSSGALAPGDRLSIRKVASTLGVSMMPVRDAVTRLVVDGDLEVLPNKAIQVPTMTVDTFCELTTVRIEIEGFAAEHAAVRRTDAQLAAMTRFASQFSDAISRGLRAKADALRSNRDFHFAVYEASGFPTLVRIIQMLWLRVGPIINLDLEISVSRGAEKALAEHARLLGAIKNRDSIEARGALKEDLLGTATFVRESGHFSE